MIRVPDLQAMHRAIAESIECADSATRTAVVVATTAAGAALERTLDLVPITSDRRARLEIVTRDGFYARLHEAMPDRPALLSLFEREVLLVKAADRTAADGESPPFRLRPGLIAEILAFYDDLRRRDRSVDDFDRLLTESLQGSIEIDRGAERLFRQTRFLASAFRRFERLVEASGRVDEHGLRALVLGGGASPPYERAIVTVADQASDPRGLWTADFDLLARMPGLQHLEVIATENVLATGFHQRVHDLLPGIEEEKRGAPAPPPILVTPAHDGDDERRWFVCRDREEELAAVARMAAVSSTPDRIAVVFQRPLPYLYLARFVFASARQPYQTLDTLPLAAEPFAAALDVVFAFLLAEANRASTIDLLASPHWRFAALDGDDASIRERVASLDVLLREIKYLGGWDRLAALAPHAEAPVRASRRASASDAVKAAIAVGDALRAVRDAPTASGQIRALLTFVAAHERLPDPASDWSSRHRRARAAVLDALASLADAHERHNDTPLSIERLFGAVRRWIDGQTFAPSTGPDGVMLLDAPAAAYADVDELRLVGLVETDWPERTRRSIFYPSSLLSQLGWPNELDRLTGARARFHDLLHLPRARVSASTFTLEDDAIVAPSSFLEELEASGLTIERHELDRARRVFVHDWLFEDDASSGALAALEGEASAWLALRSSRSSPDADAFRGATGARDPSVYAVSHVERYLECPFKYFAARVLRLDEEREDESGLSPQERGQLLHEVFETFFKTWGERGGKTITARNLDDALELFADVAEATLAKLPEADRALERTYLLGSAAAAGLGERAFNVEIEQEADVIERLLEQPLEGSFEFRSDEGPRRISIRAKADRIDLLQDGTLRVIDYKLSRAPKAARALQLPIYGVCAEQHLKGRGGRDWTVSRAGYVAFKEKNAFVSLAGPATTLEDALEQGEHRLVAAVTAIERGEFPVKPDEPYRCRWCGFAGVCRKDYIGDE